MHRDISPSAEKCGQGATVSLKTVERILWLKVRERAERRGEHGNGQVVAECVSSCL